MHVTRVNRADRASFDGKFSFYYILCANVGRIWKIIAGALRTERIVQILNAQIEVIRQTSAVSYFYSVFFFFYVIFISCYNPIRKIGERL